MRRRGPNVLAEETEEEVPTGDPPREAPANDPPVNDPPVKGTPPIAAARQRLAGAHPATANVPALPMALRKAPRMAA